MQIDTADKTAPSRFGRGGLALKTCCSVISKFVFLGVLSVLASQAAAVAQIESGPFTGTVQDPTSAVIPGALVSVTNQGTNVTATFVTDSPGVYRVGNLPPGLYTIQVQAKGFKTAIDRDLELTVGAVQRVDFRLELGAATQEVTVESVAPRINTGEGRLSSLVNANHVANLP